MKEVDTSESSGDDGIDVAAIGALKPHARVASDVREDVSLSHFDQSQLTVVTVRKKICDGQISSNARSKSPCVRLTLQAVKTGSHQSKTLIEFLFSSAILVVATKLDAAREEIPYVLGRCHNTGAIICDVVLHTRLGIDRELAVLIDRATEATVILLGVLVIGIVLGVVNVVFGSVAAQAVSSDLKFARAITESQETENAKEKANGFGGNGLDGADIDGL